MLPKNRSSSKRPKMRIHNFLLFPAIIGLTISSCSKTETPAPTPPTPPPPVANFTYSGNTLAPATISFTNQSTNASTYLWDFGEGGTSTERNPTYVFKKGGTYTVKLTANGNSTSNSTTKTVNIQAPTTVKIKTVKITGMPFVDPSCSCGWDTDSGPDVYFVLMDNANNILVTGNTINDVTSSSLPIGWTLSTPYQITNFGATYKIIVYDKDSPPLNPDDAIDGFQFQFSIWANTGYPTIIPLQLNSSQLKLELSVEWL